MRKVSRNGGIRWGSGWVNLGQVLKEEYVGLVEIDDGINNYLPFQVRNPSNPDTPITIRMLLSHTSTMRDNWDLLNSIVTFGETLLYYSVLFFKTIYYQMVIIIILLIGRTTQLVRIMNIPILDF